MKIWCTWESWDPKNDLIPWRLLVFPGVENNGYYSTEDLMRCIKSQVEHTPAQPASQNQNDSHNQE